MPVEYTGSNRKGRLKKLLGFSTLCNWKNGVLVGRTGLEKVGV